MFDYVINSKLKVKLLIKIVDQTCHLHKLEIGIWSLAGQNIEFMHQVYLHLLGSLNITIILKVASH